MTFAEASKTLQEERAELEKKNAFWASLPDTDPMAVYIRALEARLTAVEDEIEGLQSQVDGIHKAQFI